MKKKENGFEISPLSPGWIKKKVPDSYADDVLKQLVLFYVINTPCVDLSSSGLTLSSYGWSDNIWQKGELKKYLFKIANLKANETFSVAKKTNEMKSICKKTNLSKGFHKKDRDIERIAIYKGRYNEFLSICYHIRNAFAHGRLAMYSCEENDIVFVLEDGIKKGTEFQVRSRMILKKSTLKKWMDILKSGKLPNDN